MNTTKNSVRMEKLRKSRSLNDVVSIVREVAKDIMRQKKVVSKMQAVAASAPGARVSTSATVKQPKAIRIGMDGIGPQKQLKEIVTQTPSQRKEKEAGKVKFKRKPLSGGFKPAKYVAPSIDTAEKMQNKVDIIHDLHENLIELDASQEKMKQQFGKAKNLKVAMAGITALKNELEETLGKAYDLLETIAKKHIPQELEAMNLVLADFLQENIPQTKYDELREEVYVTMKAADDDNPGIVKKGPKKIKIDIKNADFAFHCYTIINNLKNSDGYEFEEYCIVLTGLVDRHGMMHYFLNALPDFKSPGKFNIGQEVTDEHEMMTRITLLLAHNDLVTEMERKPMPLSTKTAKEKGFHSIEGVESIHVVDDTLRVTIKRGEATPSKIDVIKMEVRALLKAVIGKRSNSKVLPRKVKAANGQIVLAFSLIPDIPDSDERRDYSINLGKLHDMQKALGLPDDVIEDVKKAMLHRT